MTWLSASARPAGTWLGVMSARRSNAASITAARFPVSIESIPRLIFATESGNTRRCLDARAEVRDERHPHVAAARVHAVRLAGQILAGQHRDVRGGEQFPRKRLIVFECRCTAGSVWYAGPHVETSVRLSCLHHRLQQRKHRRELLPVLRPVL